MRKISEMYRRSGGTSYQHKCGGCSYYSKTAKMGTCALHGLEPPAPWKESFIACKFFTDGSEPSVEETSGQQLSIFDILS